ncbi:MAG: FAD-dependent oxidoreductase [Saprospiraceae bacterium]
MKNNHYQILIVGAGTAGITVASQLKLKNKKLDIALVDPADKHYYQAAWTLVGAGTYNYKDTERNMKDLIPPGVSWIQEHVSGMQPEENQITTSEGNQYSYDYLVVCPGIQYDLNAIEGLEETLDKNNVCSNYTNSKYTWEVLQNFKGGNAIFTQPATPIKCGGAPQKIMYLADDYFKKSGVKNKTNIAFVTPGSVIFGVEDFKKTLMEVVDRKNIGLYFFHKITKIDSANQLLHYTITANANQPEKLFHHPINSLGYSKVSETEITIPYDMVHLAPPQSAPDFVKNSSLAHQEGPSKGWVNVNINTLQHNSYPNVFSLGDSAALPTAKTGAAVRKQAPVVVENLLHVINQEGNLSEAYKGYSSCPLVTGYGKMVLAEFDYDNNRDTDPLIGKFVDTAKENWSMWMLKKYGLPFMYWNLMLKGKA